MKALAKSLTVAAILVLGGLVGCGGGHSSPTSPGTPTLTAVTISSPASFVAAGQTMQMTATATYSDRSTRDVTTSSIWQSSDPTIATVSSSGVLTALKQGTVTATATMGAVAGTMSVAVNAPLLSSILVNPASTSLFAGQTRQVKALGVFTDGSSQDVTGQVSWSSSNQLIATVSASGLVTASGVGQASITATSGSSKGSVSILVSAAVLQSIVVTPASVSIAIGQTRQFAASGIFSDGSTTDITNSVLWDTDAHSVSTVNSAGLATGVGVGKANVTATSGTVIGSIPLNVTAAVLQSIDISPDDQSVPAGGQVQYTVTGTFSDSTTQDLTNAAFASSDPKTAVIDPATGLATGVAANSTPITITATVGAFTDSTTLTVLPATLQSLTISPTTASISQGTTQLFSVNGNFSDGTSQPLSQGLTWTSSAPAIAGVDGTGLATAIGVGQTNINVAYAGMSTSAVLTVTPAVPVSITVTPAISTVGVGGTQQFTATGVFNDGTTQDLTAVAQWVSSNASVALISNAGLASTLSKGTAQVTAQYLNVSGSATLTVSTAVLTSINVVPSAPVVPTNSRIQFTAMGVYSDGTTVPLNGVWWHTSSGSVARINWWTGLARTRAAGSVTVTAWHNGMTGSTTMTVTSSTITSVKISPVNPTIASGTTQQFALTGTYGDGAQVDLSSSAYWQTSNWRDALITYSGLAIGWNPGQVTITANYKGLSDQTTLTVSSASITSVTVKPAAPAVNVGATQLFTATANFNDGTSQDVTALAWWTSSSPTVAVVTRGGLTFTASHGTANISAKFKGVTGTAVLTVN